MMLLYIFLLLLILCQCCVYTYAQIDIKNFRKDYTYFERTQSFYKIHTLHKTWQNAIKTCAMEGAFLFYPEDKNEADVLARHLFQTQPFSWLYVAASDVLSQGFYETINGVPIMNTYHNWASGEPNAGHSQNCVVLTRMGILQDEDCAMKYPFACKKPLSALQWNKRCDSPFMDYEYDEATGHCYMFHLNPLTWSDAHATCRSELSYLAVINSPLEAEILVNLTAKAPKDIEVVGNFKRDVVHVGFQSFVFEQWITIEGIPLSDSGYTHWQKGEPNNWNNEEKCGSMYFNGGLNDVGCQQQRFFICERDVEATTSDDKVTKSNVKVDKNIGMVEQ